MSGSDLALGPADARSAEPLGPATLARAADPAGLSSRSEPWGVLLRYGT